MLILTSSLLSALIILFLFFMRVQAVVKLSTVAILCYPELLWVMATTSNPIDYHENGHLRRDLKSAVLHLDGSVKTLSRTGMEIELSSQAASRTRVGESSARWLESFKAIKLEHYSNNQQNSFAITEMTNLRLDEMVEKKNLDLACALLKDIPDIKQAKDFLSTKAFHDWRSKLMTLFEHKHELHQPTLVDGQTVDDKFAQLVSNIDVFNKNRKMLVDKKKTIERLADTIRTVMDRNASKSKMDLIKELDKAMKLRLADEMLLEIDPGLIEKIISGFERTLAESTTNQELLVEWLVTAMEDIVAHTQVLVKKPSTMENIVMIFKRLLVKIQKLKPLVDVPVLDDKQIVATNKNSIKELVLAVKQSMTDKKVLDDNQVKTDKLVFASMGTLLPLLDGRSRMPDIIASAVKSENKELQVLGSTYEDIYLDQLIEVSEAQKIWKDMGLVYYINTLGTDKEAKFAITKLLIKLNDKGGASLVDDVVKTMDDLNSYLYKYLHRAALFITERKAIDVLKKLVSEKNNNVMDLIADNDRFALFVDYATFDEYRAITVQYLRTVTTKEAVLAYKSPSSYYLKLVQDEAKKIQKWKEEPGVP
ncbi:hypothetical protein Plhal304r1_c018g0065971 [Plasmopara halstedii]